MAGAERPAGHGAQRFWSLPRFLCRVFGCIGLVVRSPWRWRPILLVGVCLSGAGMVGGEDRANKELCRFDGDCSGYYRCQDQICVVPPAVLGRSDVQTPVVEFLAGEMSRGRFFVELAREGFEQRRGLSQRPFMAEGWGMLFVYPNRVQNAFTMALMRFPLDMIFIGDDGVVVDLIEDAQPKTQLLVPSSTYRYVLELNAGAVRAHGIQVGDRMELSGPPIGRETGGG